MNYLWDGIRIILKYDKDFNVNDSDNNWRKISNVLGRKNVIQHLSQKYWKNGEIDKLVIHFYDHNSITKKHW